jgi:O-antigen/teichoic acid export membrane protein
MLHSRRTMPAKRACGVSAAAPHARMMRLAATFQGSRQSKRSALTLGTTFAILGMGLVSGALLARLLGVQGRGLLAAVILWPSIVAYLGDLGGPLAYTYLAATQPTKLRFLIGNAFALTLVQATALSLIGIPIILFALQKYPKVVGVAVAFLLVYLPLNLLSRYLNAIQQGLRQFGRFNAVRLSVQLSYLLGVLVIFALGLNQIIWAVVVILISNIITTLVTLLFLFRSAWGRPGVDFALAKQTFHYGLRAHIGNLTPIDSMQLDLLVVVAILGARNAGLYAVAASAAMVVRAQGGALGMVALPHVAAALTIEEKREVAISVFRLALVLHLITAIGIVAVAGILVPAIYGKEFADAIPIVRVLVLGIVAASLRQVLADCLRGLGRPLTGTIAEVASWSVAVAGLIILVPSLATIGAALAASLSYATALFISVGFAQRSGISWRQLFLPRMARRTAAAPSQLT